ncbi:MAG TPA: glycosyltransferase family 39 protein [Thermoanaerobaculia bacterium]|nr:glycosyltransferase family 39 protein [Thermoanaerobaculia bacterium]
MSLFASALTISAFVFGHLLAWLALAATAYVAGRTLLRRDLESRQETAAVATTLGLVAIANAGLLLGFAGLLRPGPALAALAALHLASLPGWRALAREGARLARRLPPPTPRLAPAALAALAALATLATIIALLPFVALALYPPTAFDATLYHLPFARAFAASGGLPFLPRLRSPIFPQLQEVLFALLLLFFDDVAAHAVAALATALTVALLLAWGGRGFTRGAGWIAAAAYAGSPIVVYLSGTAYVEPGLVLFATAAMYALARWREAGERRWLALAAVFGAAAADSKYLGLYFLGVVALGAVAERPPRLPQPAPHPGTSAAPVSAAGRPAGRWRRLGVVAVAGGLLLAPWYARILLATGNPVFPFLPEIFGASPWTALNVRSPGELGPRLGELVVALVRAPWDVVFARQRLGGYPPYSPVYLLALPALAAAAWRDRRVRALLLVSAAYALVVLALLPDARYLLVALPLVSLATGEAVASRLGLVLTGRADPEDAAAFACCGTPGRSETALRCRGGGLLEASIGSPPATPRSPSHPSGGEGDASSPGARTNFVLTRGGRVSSRLVPARPPVLAAIALACFLPGWLYAGYRLAKQGPLPVTAAARDRYLARALPIYPAIRYLNLACGPSYSLYSLHAENMAYFAAGRFLGDWTGPAAFWRVVPADGDPGALDRNLRALGADHLLTVEGKSQPLALDGAAFRARFHLVYSDRHARLFALEGAACPPPR